MLSLGGNHANSQRTKNLGLQNQPIRTDSYIFWVAPMFNTGRSVCNYSLPLVPFSTQTCTPGAHFSNRPLLQSN